MLSLSLDRRRRKKSPRCLPLSLVLLLLLLALLSCCGSAASRHDSKNEADKQLEAGLGAVPPVPPLAGAGPVDGGGAASAAAAASSRHKTAGANPVRTNSVASEARAAREAAREAVRAFERGATRTAGDAAVRILGVFFSFDSLAYF